MQICSSYTMPSRDLCKIHEGMFDKPEGLSHLPECFCIDPMGWHGITDLYHPREYGMIPRATPSGSSHTPSCGSRQSIAHPYHPEKCAPYIHFSCTNTNGFIHSKISLSILAKNAYTC